MTLKEMIEKFKERCESDPRFQEAVAAAKKLAEQKEEAE